MPPPQILLCLTNRPCQQEGSATGTKEMLDLFSENRTMPINQPDSISLSYCFHSSYPLQLMSYHKHYLFELNPTAIARFCRTFLHPARTTIIFFLLKKKSLTPYSEIKDQIPLSRASVSRHLQKLMDEKIVVLQNMGNKTNYVVDTQVLKDYAFLFRDLSDRLYKLTKDEQ